MATHTISNSSTFRGWLESMGVDDMIFDPCGCIFGETQPDPVPIPGARFNRQMSNQGLLGLNQSEKKLRKCTLEGLCTIGGSFSTFELILLI